MPQMRSTTCGAGVPAKRIMSSVLWSALRSSWLCHSAVALRAGCRSIRSSVRIGLRSLTCSVRWTRGNDRACRARSRLPSASPTGGAASRLQCGWIRCAVNPMATHSALQPCTDPAESGVGKQWHGVSTRWAQTLTRHRIQGVLLVDSGQRVRTVCAVSKFLFLLIGVVCLVSGLCAHPVVTNVVASQRADTQLVDITYDLVGAGVLERTLRSNCPGTRAGFIRRRASWRGITVREWPMARAVALFGMRCGSLVFESSHCCAGVSAADAMGLDANSFS